VHQLLEGPPVPLMEQHTGPQFGPGSPLPSPPHFPAATRLHSTGTLEVEEAEVVEEVEEEER